MVKKTEKIHTLLCNIQNIQKTIKHKVVGKSKLTPYSRHQIANNMKFKPAILVRFEIGSNLITTEGENIELPVLPSISALRQIKSDAKFGEFDENPLTLLIVMAKTLDYANTFREIHVQPHFHCLSQCNVNLELVKKK